MNTDTIRLFDSKNKLIDNYDKTIELVLKEVHGDNYFDIDEDFTKKIELKEEEKTIIKKKQKITFKDFIPVLFFMLIFAILIIGGYYFLNNFDFTRFIK